MAQDFTIKQKQADGTYLELYPKTVGSQVRGAVEDSNQLGGHPLSYYATAEGLAKFGKLLWSGSFSSGSITVPEISNYRAVCVILAGDVMCFGTPSWGIGGIGTYSSYVIALYGYRLTPSDDTLSINDNDKGGSDGTQNIAITAIYGLF